MASPIGEVIASPEIKAREREGHQKQDNHQYVGCHLIAFAVHELSNSRRQRGGQGE
jgi:hypothetical protein